LRYFLKKALIKNGLEISGMRMVYLDEDQVDLYYHLFNEKLHLSVENPSKNSLLAFFIRGIDAIAKCEKIIGHFNPDTARKTNEKSLRSLFGKDKDHNCVLKMFAS
jgi:nucleoside diphosphate kinase